MRNAKKIGVILVCMALLVISTACGSKVEAPDDGPKYGPTDNYTIAVLVLPLPGLRSGWQPLEFSRIYDGFKTQTDAEIVVVAPIDGVKGVWDTAREEVAVNVLYDYNPGDIDALVVIGGNGPGEWLEDIQLQVWLRELAQLDRPMGGVCGGVTILASADLLAGRTVATNSKYRDILIDYGVVYTGEGLEQDGQFWTFSFGEESNFLREFLPVFAGVIE